MGYKYSVSHYFESSIEPAYSAVEPGDEPDLIKIVSLHDHHWPPPYVYLFQVNILKTRRVPFAVRCILPASNIA